MKLLFDQNLSHKLVLQLADIFPDSAHVRQISLRDADDRTVWDYARDHECIIVTKDSDFADLSYSDRPQLSSGFALEIARQMILLSRSEKILL